jgi:hypothetical protein
VPPVDHGELFGPAPVGGFPVDWAAVEQALGLRLPVDYTRFAEAYGPGDVGGRLRIWVPTSDQLTYNPTGFGLYEFEPTVRAFWPAPGGLLMWGHSVSADVFYWDTSAAAEADRWPVVVYCPDSATDAWRTLPMPMTDVLAAVVSGEIRCAARSAPRGPLPATYTWRAAIEPAPWRRGDPAVRPPVAASVEHAQRVASTVAGAGAVSRVGWTGVEVPPDYQALIDMIGPGTLGQNVRLLAPGAADGFDLLVEQDRHAARLSGLRAAGAGVPAPFHPEPAGMRLWAVFGTGETCWWLPAWHRPAGWPVVICSTDGLAWQRLDLSACQFLARWLDGAMDLPVLAADAVPRDRSVRADTDGVAPMPTPGGRRRDPVGLLASLLGPGAAVRPCDWSATEALLGVRVPTDYKQILDRYGSSPVEGISIAESPAGLLDSQHVIEDPREPGHPVFPEPGGLLFCGFTENGDYFWWDTSNPNPDQWTMLLQADFDKLTPFAGTFTEMLIASLTGRGPELLANRPDMPRYPQQP